MGLEAQDQIFSPSVKGKKGIARSKASLTLAKGGVGVCSNLKDSSSPEINPFLDSRKSNSKQIFTFQSSMGRSH